MHDGGATERGREDGAQDGDDDGQKVPHEVSFAAVSTGRVHPTATRTASRRSINSERVSLHIYRESIDDDRRAGAAAGNAVPGPREPARAAPSAGPRREGP
ncbi:hypothetical protein GCM10023215_62150 [Pseudonocardia yuanmonensis]|uniref:Uncharacterized protein n=1 Tax=Pseudonocardia yuanmonensis TaxID=1095914 RepID=A0ABP8XNL8_9PSEU